MSQGNYGIPSGKIVLIRNFAKLPQFQVKTVQFHEEMVNFQAKTVQKVLAKTIKFQVIIVKLFSKNSHKVR